MQVRKIQYIPITDVYVLFCFALLWLYHHYEIDSCDLFIHIIQGYFTGIMGNHIEVTLKDMGKIDQYLTTTKHNEA